MTAPGIAERVTAGEAFMDATDPGWWREGIDRAIDLRAFDIARSDACVLGQRCPLESLAEWAGAGSAENLDDADMDCAYYVNAVRLLRLMPDDRSLTEWAVAHGFTGDSDEMEALTVEWARRITVRREEARRG